MKTHQLSIAFQTDKTPGEYIALAKMVNQYRFDVVSVYCDLPYHPSYGPLLLMAPHITTARIGPAAISPARMHPVDIAASSALLSGTAQKGVYVGLARGAWLDEFGIEESQKPIQMIREACLLIRKILHNKTYTFEGEIYNISKSIPVPYPIPEGETPIMIGTWGQKLAEVSGEIANEVKVGGSTNPEFGIWIKKHVRTGERRAGRLENTVGIVMGAVTVVDENRKMARIKAKEALVQYFPVVAKLDRTLSIDPDLVQQVRTLVAHGERQQAANLISDDLLLKFAFSGNPDDLICQSEAIFDAGLNRVEFGTPHGIQPLKGIELIGRKVLPYLSEKWGHK
jgi:5,10-methylenetetrahydromethanopterin reductase